MRKGIFIPGISVDMFRNASLEAVEEFMCSGQMEDIVIPERPHGTWVDVPKYKGFYVCSKCLERLDGDFDRFDHWEMYIPVPDISRTVKMLEIEKQCVLRQDTPQCTRECSFCDLVQNADEVISAYDTAINILKQLLEKVGDQK